MSATAVAADERVARTSLVTTTLRRPELGALVAALAVFIFFATYTEQFTSELGVSTWLNNSSRLGIMAVAVALLMIGGEFDLSTGVMTGTTGLIVGVATTHYGLNIWLAVVVSLAAALVIGAINGIVVVRTGLPSFIVTLGTYFVLQGLNLALVKAIIGGVSVQGMIDVPQYDSIQPIFGGTITLDGYVQTGLLPGAIFLLIGVGAGVAVLRLFSGSPTIVEIVGGCLLALVGLVAVVYAVLLLTTLAEVPHYTFGASVLWWVGVTAVATWVLLRTRPGNWIFAVGGAQQSARQVGVPVFKTKVGLFMTTAGAGWLVGMILLFESASATSERGVGDEFIFIICAVVGGCLLTGGYGSAIGAALGALIYGMANQGIVYAQWDNNWLQTFLGAMLLAAVLLNNWVRKRAEVAR
ncbi:MAG TPA: ABC transporter permease [Nocardioidaceae bacterium]|nr:ABC transporter permease [Nocardioidaceae bacterium]